MKLTDKLVASLKAKEREYLVNEGRGFNVRVLPTGTKSFLYIYQLGGARRKMALGRYPEVSLGTAREAYNDAYKLVRAGIDPVTRKLEERQEEGRRLLEEVTLRDYDFETLLDKGRLPEDFVPLTFGQLAAAYCLDYSRTRHSPAVQRNLLYTLRTGLLPEFGDLELRNLTRRGVIPVIQKIARTTPGQAENVLKAGRQIYEYAAQLDLTEVQPFLAITKAVPAARSSTGERILTDAEIRTVWERILTSPSAPAMQRALLLVLVTAQREGEIVQMHRSQIDGEWWTIPAAVAKNGREHRVYLTQTAKELLGEGKGYLFPALRNGRAHIATNSLSQLVNRGELTGVVLKQVGVRKIKERINPYFGLPRWTPHDLRRTARTGLARLGVIEEVAEEILNHKKRGVSGIYNKYRYDKEKQEALLRWEALLMQIRTA